MVNKLPSDLLKMFEVLIFFSHKLSFSKKDSKYLSIQIWIFPVFLYKALLLKEIKIV